MSNSNTYSGVTLEVPAQPEAPTPVVPDAPSTPVVPDPGTPGDPAEPATVPGPAEPAEPVAPPDPGPTIPPEPAEPQTQPASWFGPGAPEGSADAATREPVAPALVFPPIPTTTDPRRPENHDDALAPAVPAYAAPEPMPDPAPAWLSPQS